MFSIGVSQNFRNILTHGDEIIGYSVKVKRSGGNREWLSKSTEHFDDTVTVSLYVYYKKYESAIFKLLKTSDINLSLSRAAALHYVVDSVDVENARDKFFDMVRKLFNHGYIKVTHRDTIVNEIAGDNTAMRDQLTSSIGII